MKGIELCQHGAGVIVDDQVVGCTFCSGKETTIVVKADKPVDWWVEAKAPIDPGVVMAMRVAEGLVCPACRSDYAPIGCDCSRKRHHRLSIAEAADWAHQAVDDFVIGEKEAAAMIMGAARRSQRRAALVYEPADDDQPQGVTVAQEEHLGLMAEFGVKPTWHAPRVNEPTHLPV